ncbi:MAG: hypothetical protein C0597_10375 [Marinilabiliales bacterium]|nr:MAG: hypothetical protein C0597_10375 [Marinilabiliales bacterium]
MEEKSNSIWKAGLTYGAILGLLLIIYTVILYVFDQSFNKFLGYVSFLLMATMAFYGAKSYRDNSLNGFISYGRSLGISMIIIAVAGIISSIYFMIHINVIDPDYIVKLLANSEEQLLNKGFSDEQIEMSLAMQQKMMKPALIVIIGLLGSAFWGFIISLITSIFVKKQGDPYQEAMQDIEE